MLTRQRVLYLANILFLCFPTFGFGASHSPPAHILEKKQPSEVTLTVVFNLDPPRPTAPFDVFYGYEKFGDSQWFMFKKDFYGAALSGNWWGHLSSWVGWEGFRQRKSWFQKTSERAVWCDRRCDDCIDLNKIQGPCRLESEEDIFVFALFFFFRKNLFSGASL